MIQIFTKFAFYQQPCMIVLEPLEFSVLITFSLAQFYSLEGLATGIIEKIL